MADGTVVLDDGSPPGHNEKMLGMSAEPNEGEGGGNEQQVAQRPDNVPEKFWDAEKGEINTEALLKSQADAEAALRKGLKPEGDEQKPEGEGEGADNEPANQAGAVEAASTEWAEKGELSAETYTALEAVGLSKDMVDTYIDGQKAIVGKLQDAAYGPFDGQEGYDAAANWAANTLTEDEIKALDVQLTSNNPAIVAQGAKALHARFEKDGDREPEAIRGDGNSHTTGGTYKSSREMMKDMNSALYRTSQAFRDEVASKLSRSNL
jgi:hypothetical protein